MREGGYGVNSIINSRHYENLKNTIWNEPHISVKDKLRFSSAIEDLLENPEDPEAHLYVGVLLYKAGHSDMALAEYKKILEKFPDYLEVYVDIGYAYRLLGNFKLSEEFFKKALDHNPEDDNALLGLGLLYVDMNRIDEAVSHLQKSIRLDPKYAEAYNDLGNIFLKTGRYREAEVEYRKAIKRDPGVSGYYCGLSQALIKQKKYTDAEGELKKAIKLNPNDDLAHTNLGDLYDMLEKPDKAEYHTRLALQINPNNCNAHATLGLIYLRKKLVDIAESEFKKSIALNPRYVAGYVDLGIIQFNKKDYAEAIENFEKAIAIEPYNPELSKIGLLVKKYQEILEESLKQGIDSYINELLTDYINKKLISGAGKENILKDVKTQSYSGNIIIPDTNALIDYPDLSLYSSFASGESTIMLTPVVLKELDSIKMNKKKSTGARKNAKNVIKAIDEIKQKGNLSDGVKIGDLLHIKWVEVEPNFDSCPKWLDPGLNDDYILATIIEIKKKYFRAKVILLTSDINLTNKADCLKIDYLKPRIT